MRLKEGNKEKDILQAAIKVFADVGFHDAKIAQIAGIAGVATGSVYVYFKNKNDLLNKIFLVLWEQLYVELKIFVKNSYLTPVEKIDGMLDLILDVFTENPNLALVFVNEQNHVMKNDDNELIRYYEKFLDEGEKVLKEGINKGVFSPSINVKIFRHYIFGAIRNLLRNWAISPKSFALDEIKLNIKFLIKYGIQKSDPKQ